jgi:hypothetical protein
MNYLIRSAVLKAICVLLFAVAVAGECCERQPVQWHQQKPEATDTSN